MRDRISSGAGLLFLVIPWLLPACRQVETGPIGAACGETRECEVGYCQPEEKYDTPTGWVDGYCTESCPDGICPAGSRCYQAASLCLAPCQAAADCRSGYVCLPGEGVCWPDCRVELDCGDRLVCNADGLCVLPDTNPDAGTTDGGANDGGETDGGPLDLGASDIGLADVGPLDPPDLGILIRRPVGSPCQLALQCVGEVCIREQPNPNPGGPPAWPGGYCTAACPGDCLLPNACVPLPAGPTCLAPCRPGPGPGVGNECRPGYLCMAHTGQGGRCMPDCAHGVPCPPEQPICLPSGYCAIR